MTARGQPDADPALGEAGERDSQRLGAAAEQGRLAGGQVGDEGAQHHGVLAGREVRPASVWWCRSSRTRARGAPPGTHNFLCVTTERGAAQLLCV
jgi:hypothetical protein